jgi:hypothetical protein
MAMVAGELADQQSKWRRWSANSRRLANAPTLNKRSPTSTKSAANIQQERH